MPKAAHVVGAPKSTVITGFVPTPLEKVVDYWPSTIEFLVALGVYAIGGLVLTVLYKVAIGVREELQA